VRSTFLNAGGQVRDRNRCNRMRFKWVLPEADHTGGSVMYGVAVVRGDEKDSGYGQMMSPLVATKAPAFGHCDRRIEVVVQVEQPSRPRPASRVYIEKNDEPCSQHNTITAVPPATF
jgi:hypothetical protein